MQPHELQCIAGDFACSMDNLSGIKEKDWEALLKIEEEKSVLEGLKAIRPLCLKHIRSV